MNTRTPAAGASATSRITRAGDRCAEATVILHVTPSSVNTLPAADMISASESDPIKIRTCVINPHSRVIFIQLIAGPHPRSPAQRRFSVAGFADFS
jgi:hypothetical protein